MRLGVIADSHVAVGERALESAAWHNPFRLDDSLARLARAVEHPLLRAADALVVLGDLVHFGDAASMRAVLDVLGHAEPHVVAISGNHDVMDADVRLHREIAATRSAVWSPACTGAPDELLELFSSEGIGLQVVDVVAEWPTPEQPFAVAARTLVAGDTGAPGVTFTHFPLVGFQERVERAGFLYAGHLDQLAARPDIDRAWSMHLVLSGHLHLRAVTHNSTTVQISFGALVEAPYEIAALDITRRADRLEVSCAYESLHRVVEDRVPVLVDDRPSMLVT